MADQDKSPAPHSHSTAPAVVAEAEGDQSSSPVEIQLCDEVRDEPQVEGRWTMMEVWTHNSIYRLDLNLRCHEIVDRTTGEPDRKHGLLGARLLGGQRTDDQRTILTHPFPRPGTEAVFEQPRGDGVVFSHSSPVKKVVLRLRSVDIRTGREGEAWNQIAGSGR